MWIQVRTMDGKVAHSVGSLSRLTKVEELREKIQELFHVEPSRQRLFYRGKQVRPPCRLPAAQQAPLFLSRPGFAPPPPAHSDPRPPAPPSGPASCLRRKLPCLSQEQRPGSQTDTLGRQLALGSVAFGLLTLPFPLIVFEAPQHDF